MAYPTQTGKCGFDQILPLLKKKNSPLPVALISAFILNCPASANSCPELISCSCATLSLSPNTPELSLSGCVGAPPGPPPHTFWQQGGADLLTGLSTSQVSAPLGCRAYLGQVCPSARYRSTSC
uniref:Uncharacterized protein n=1 Tax=Myotis myotis TaxID=51298 RepID=A0A7J7T5P9_MYOMY|nr:hypothetical protein mMyoMyo1_009150 [Myotis myotis]